jgi:capsular polysaccharide biosynthesis protein
MTDRRFYGFDPAEVQLLLRKIVREADPGVPAIHHLTDVVALPVSGGLYDLDGLRVEEAAPRTLSAGAPSLRREKLHKRAAGAVQIPPALKIVDEPVYYAGHLMKHYGHFIIDSMSRLWARDDLRGLPIVFTSPRKWRDPPSYGTDVLSALGLTSGIWLIDEPTLFRKVVCPSTSFEYRWKTFSVADLPHRQVANVLSRRAKRNWKQPVYLTRSGLTDDLRRSAEEPELESELAARGFEIVRPEDLPLAEQIGLFEQAPLVAGTLGSALHTALFSRTGGKLAILNWGRGFEHYMLVDAVKRHTAYYLKSMHRHFEGRQHVIDVARSLDLLAEAGLVASRSSVSVLSEFGT